MWPLRAGVPTTVCSFAVAFVLCQTLLVEVNASNACTSILCTAEGQQALLDDAAFDDLGVAFVQAKAKIVKAAQGSEARQLQEALVDDAASDDLGVVLVQAKAKIIKAAQGSEVRQQARQSQLRRGPAPTQDFDWSEALGFEREQQIPEKAVSASSQSSAPTSVVQQDFPIELAELGNLPQTSSELFGDLGMGTPASLGVAQVGVGPAPTQVQPVPIASAQTAEGAPSGFAWSSAGHDHDKESTEYTQDAGSGKMKLKEPWKWQSPQGLSTIPITYRSRSLATGAEPVTATAETVALQPEAGVQLEAQPQEISQAGSQEVVASTLGKEVADASAPASELMGIEPVDWAATDTQTATADVENQQQTRQQPQLPQNDAGNGQDSKPELASGSQQQRWELAKASAKVVDTSADRSVDSDSLEGALSVSDRAPVLEGISALKGVMSSLMKGRPSPKLDKAMLSMKELGDAPLKLMAELQQAEHAVVKGAPRHDVLKKLSVLRVASKDLEEKAAVLEKEQAAYQRLYEGFQSAIENMEGAVEKPISEEESVAA